MVAFRRRVAAPVAQPPVALEGGAGGPRRGGTDRAAAPAGALVRRVAPGAPRARGLHARSARADTDRGVGGMGSVAVSAHVAGAGYVEAMERDPADREYRRAFLELALTRVAPGGRI